MMEERLILSAGSAAAARYAFTYLSDSGLQAATSPSPDVTELLLDVPSFEASGCLRFGGSVERLLAQLPKDITVYGGNLDHPALAGYKKVDLLKDPGYLAENAYITAECALDVALPYLSITLRNCPTLILGWGRIGKCLGNLLKQIGADVTFAARKETDRAMIRALGFKAVDFSETEEQISSFRLIFNTVPEMVLCREVTALCHPDCVKIELASRPGIDAEDVIIARGLPGIHMPESSGKLIAETFLRLYQKEG